MLKSTHRSAAGGVAAHDSAPLPEGWTEHTAPSGHRYYYNSITKQSTYTRPAAAPEEPEELLIDYNATQPDANLHATAQALDEFHRNSDPSGPTHFTGGKSYQDRPRRGHGGDRPKSKQLIPGAEPWLIVKTEYGRRFVHNTESKQSLWKFPQDVMMAVIELDRVDWEQKQKDKDRAEQREEDEKKPETAKGRNAVARANAMRRQEQEQEAVEAESSDYEDVEVTDDEAVEGAPKRPRLDDDQPPQPPGPVELNEEDIEWQLAHMEEAELDNDYDEDEEEGLPMTEEDNIALFRSLLDDTCISPYSTFEKLIENDAVIEDGRYTALPNMHRRKEVFTDWSRHRIAEIQEHKALQQSGRGLDPKVTYLRFLQKYATPKLYWPEFKRKYKREAEMKNYEISDKEREKLYRDLVAKLKLGDSVRRKELLGSLKAAKDDLDRNSSVGDLPDAVLRDVRFYLIDETRRNEIVEGYLSTL